MKNLLFGLIATVVLGYVGNAQIDVKRLAPILAKDKNFITYVNNISKIPNKINTKEILRINKKSINTPQDKENLAIAFGFQNSKEAQSFENENVPLMEKISENYSFKNVKSDVLEELIKTTIDLIPEYSNVTTVDCKKRRSSCLTGAMAVYGIEYAGCIAVGVTVAGGSFWCAGCLGVGVGAACLTAATVHLVSMSDTCDFNYEDCVQNN